MKTGMHALAIEVTRREGKKVSVNVAQTKEILRVLVDIISEPGGTQKFKVLCEAIKNKVNERIENRPKHKPRSGRPKKAKTK